MTQIDLITGFLGAGKTTFIRRYATYLQKKGISFVIVENDFGVIGTDAMILKQEQLPVSELSGGCLCCTLKSNFRGRLLELVGTTDRIIVEPSGIYDLKEFFDIMDKEVLQKVCGIASVITIVDPQSLLQLDENSAAVLSSQLVGSGRVVWSKAEGLAPEVLDRAAKMLPVVIGEGSDKNILELPPIYPVPSMLLTDADFEQIMDSPPVFQSYNGPSLSHALSYEKDFFYPVKADSQQALAQEWEQILEDGSCGKILRVKGFAQLEGGETCAVNYTQGKLEVEPAASGLRPIINVIGYDLDHPSMAAYLNTR